MKQTSKITRATFLGALCLCILDVPFAYGSNASSSSPSKAPLSDSISVESTVKGTVKYKSEGKEQDVPAILTLSIIQGLGVKALLLQNSLHLYPEQNYKNL